MAGKEKRMKLFLKIFIIAFLGFTIVIGAGIWSYFKYSETFASKVEENKGDIGEISKEDQEENGLNPLNKSKRVNILLLGMEGPRTDTMMLLSFDPKNNGIDLISIPRDTYYPRKGHSAATKWKINAVYGDEGIEGTANAVSDVLGGIPVHYYVKVTYDGVEKIVDSLGGVKVDIPMNMDYDDPRDKPPLHIHFKKGTQVLDGKNAIKFLRFRKGNNGGGYPRGDIGRIKAHHQFMNEAMKKALGFRLPVVASQVFKNVKTDMPLTEILLNVKNAVGISHEDLNTYVLPGKDGRKKGLSYFFYDEEATKELMRSIYEGRIE